MKALFIGGTGIISTAVSKLAVEKGIDLFLLNRGLQKEFFPKGATHIESNINDIVKVKSLIANQHFDVVVDWLAYTKKDIERDINLFANNTKQFVFISSASVYKASG